MKKFISISIAAIMMIALASVFVFADDKKSTTIATENTIALEDDDYSYEEIYGKRWYVNKKRTYVICTAGGKRKCPSEL